MKRFSVCLLASALLLGSTSARADEFGYRLADKVGLAGLTTGIAVGPPLIGVGALLLVTTDTDQLTNQGVAGGTLVFVGGTLTLLAAPVVAFSALAGTLALQDMDLRPTMLPVAIGLVGFGLEFFALFAGAASPELGVATLVIGWTTAMAGGGVQMSVNNKHWQDYQARTPRSPRYRVQLVPTGNGLAVAGRF